MKKTKIKLTLMMLLLILIGFGFKANSQINDEFIINSYQLKQIRLSVNKADYDSLMLIQKKIETDTLHEIIKYQQIRINNADTIQKLQYEKIKLLKQAAEIQFKRFKNCRSENLILKRKTRNRNLVLLASGILNTLFIIKSIK